MAATGATTAMAAAYDITAGTVALFETAAVVDTPLDESDLASTTGYLVRGVAKGK